MTTIVAISQDGVVYMGADSCSLSNWLQRNMYDDKIIKTGDIILGFSGQTADFNLLKYNLNTENNEKLSSDVYINTVVVKEVKRILKESGRIKIDSGVETMVDNSILVGYDKVIFKIDNAFSVVRYTDNYDSVGVGSEFALGSLFSTKESLDVHSRLETALYASSKFSLAVLPPFTFKEL